MVFFSNLTLEPDSTPPPEFVKVLEEDSPIGSNAKAGRVLSEEVNLLREDRINRWLQFAAAQYRAPDGTVFWSETDSKVKYKPTWEYLGRAHSFAYSTAATWSQVSSVAPASSQVNKLFPITEEHSKGWTCKTKPVGEGNAGVVMIGKVKSSKREVAIKLARPSVLHAHKLVWEAEVMKSIQGYDVGPEVYYLGFIRSSQKIQGRTRHLGLVMERLGPALQDVMVKDRRPFGVQPAACYGSKLVDCFERLHGQGWLHRSVKPHNVCLTRDLTDVRLIDFGGCFRLSDVSGGHVFKVFKGRTAKFRSPWMLQGLLYRRRDDLTALALMIRHLVYPLPWHEVMWNLEQPWKSDWWNDVFGPYPKEFGLALKVALKLNADSIPPYKLLRRMYATVTGGWVPPARQLTSDCTSGKPSEDQPNDHDDFMDLGTIVNRDMDQLPEGAMDNYAAEEEYIMPEEEDIYSSSSKKSSKPSSPYTSVDYATPKGKKPGTPSKNNELDLAMAAMGGDDEDFTF